MNTFWSIFEKVKKWKARVHRSENGKTFCTALMGCAPWRTKPRLKPGLSDSSGALWSTVVRCPDSGEMRDTCPSPDTSVHWKLFIVALMSGIQVAFCVKSLQPSLHFFENGDKMNDVKLEWNEVNILTITDYYPVCYSNTSLFVGPEKSSAFKLSDRILHLEIIKKKKRKCLKSRSSSQFEKAHSTPALLVM